MFSICVLSSSTYLLGHPTNRVCGLAKTSVKFAWDCCRVTTHLLIYFTVVSELYNPQTWLKSHGNPHQTTTFNGEFPMLYNPQTQKTWDDPPFVSLSTPSVTAQCSAVLSHAAWDAWGPSREKRVKRVILKSASWMELLNGEIIGKHRKIWENHL